MNDIQFENDRFDFIAPQSIADCVRRLNAQHEERSFWAWRGSMRTTVQLTREDDLTVAFKIRRVPKNSWWNGGASVFIEGRLVAMSANQTHVSGRLEFLTLWTLFGMVLIIAMAIYFAAFAETGGAFALLILILGGGFTIVHILWQRSILIGVLKSAFRRTGF